MCCPPLSAVRADAVTERVGVRAEGAVQQDGYDPAAVVRCDPRGVFGPGDIQQGVAEGLAVVGDGQDVLLDDILDRRGVERVWGVRDAIGFWIPAPVSGHEGRLFAGMTLRQAQGRLPIHRLRTGAGSGAQGLVQGVVDLCDEPGGLGFFVGLRRGAIRESPPVSSTGQALHRCRPCRVLARHRG